MEQIPDVLTTAAARELGLTAWTVRTSGLVSPHRGLWAPRPGTTLLEAARQAGALVRGDWAVDGWQAAELHGLPVPRSWRAGDTVRLRLPTSSGRVRRPGIATRRGLERREVVDVRGVPVVGLLDTAADLAAAGASHDDLVRVGDAYLHRCADEAGLLRRGVDGRPGSRRLRRALADVRRGAESCKETDLRLLCVRAGLPEPELQVQLFDERGWLVCRFDLYWEEYALGAEFDGDGHRVDRRRWQSDRKADRRAQMLGHRRVRFTHDDLVPGRTRETLHALRVLMRPPSTPPRGRLRRTVRPGPVVGVDPAGEWSLRR